MADSRFSRGADSLGTLATICTSDNCRSTGINKLSRITKFKDKLNDYSIPWNLTYSENEMAPDMPDSWQTTRRFYDGNLLTAE